MNQQVQILDAAPALPSATSQQPVSRNEPVDAEIEALRKSEQWLLVIRTVGGQRRILDKQEFLAVLRTGILDGGIHGTSTVDVHSCLQQGTWQTTSSPLAQFAKGHFRLRVLFEPVWSHALAGLKWGALVGIGLKLLDTLVLLGSVDPALALLFLVTIGVCLIPRIGVAGVVAVSVATSKFTKANFFMMGLAAALVGAILGCLPGMAIGGLIGLWRNGALPRAKDAVPESPGLVLSAVVLPLLCGAALLAFYVLVFNPWLTSVMQSS
jgi:hypothetical protein